MTRPSRSRRWAMALAGLSAAALVVCVVATVEAGWPTPVFSSSVPEGTEIVQTKQQYEAWVIAQGLGRLAAVVTLVSGLGAAVLMYLSPRARRTP